MRWIPTDLATAILVSVGLHSIPFLLVARFPVGDDDTVQIDAHRGGAVAVSLAPSLTPGSGAIAHDRSSPVPESHAVGSTGDTTAEGAIETGILAGEISRVNRVLEYPALARKMEIQGLVRIRVTTGEDGRPRSVAVDTSSGHEILDRAARRSIESWTFRIRNRTFVIPVRYVLE